jgi:hypothetical protein
MDGTSTTDIVTFEEPATTEDSVTVGVSSRKMAPDGTPTEAITSADVFTIIPYNEFGCAVPITIPVIVAMKAAVPVALPAVISTKEDAETELHVAFKRKTLELPDSMRGTLSVEKKPVGYERVILPPDGIDIEGVNPRVIATPTRLASLSSPEIPSETDATDVAHPHIVLTGTSGQIAPTAVGLYRFW